MIRIKCPNQKCAKVLGLDDSQAGGVGTCPTCGQKFKIPAASAKAASSKPTTNPKGPPAKSAAPASPGKKPWQEDDDFTPYAPKQEEEDSGPPDDDRVDEMVKDNWRKKKRERAWDEVGAPAKVLKIIGLVWVAINIILFLLVTLDVVLYIFKMSQVAAGDLPVGSKEADSLPVLMFDLFDSRPGKANAGLNWFIYLGIFGIDTLILGLIIAGAEKMKRLDSYNMAMTGCILAIVFGGGFLTIVGVWGLMTLLNEKVKLQFPKFKKLRQEKEEEEWEELEEARRRIREGLEEEEVDEEGMPVKPKKRKRSSSGKKSSAGSEGSSTLLYTLLACGIACVVLGILTIFLPPVGLALFGLGILVGIWGNIWFLVVAFQEEMLQGILVMFVPFYALYYLVTRWNESKTPFFIGVAGSVLAFVGMVLFIVGTASQVIAVQDGAPVP